MKHLLFLLMMVGFALPSQADSSVATCDVLINIPGWHQTISFSEDKQHGGQGMPGLVYVGMTDGVLSVNAYSIDFKKAYGVEKNSDLTDSQFNRVNKSEYPVFTAELKKVYKIDTRVDIAGGTVTITCDRR